MSGAAPDLRHGAALRPDTAEVQRYLDDPNARRAAAAELRALAATLGASLRRGRTAEPGQVAALQRAINLYTGGPHLEVDDHFGRHTERALRDVQAALRADARVRDDSQIGGGRAAAPTLQGLADALDSAAPIDRALRDRFQRVHAQPNVVDPIGRGAARRVATRPAPAEPRERAPSAREPRAPARPRPRPTRAPAAPEGPAVRDRAGGPFSIASLRATGPDLNIPHYVQPDGSTCIPTTQRMIRAAGGHIGRERVGNNEAVRFDGALLRRVLTQLQTTGIQMGVRSRESAGGAIRGSSSGHVVALTGYQFVDARGRRVANGDVQAAVADTGGDWNRLLGALDRRGIRLRLDINDPGINGRSPGARSHLDVAPNGLIRRPAIGGRYVSLGHYTVRYFMLD